MIVVREAVELEPEHVRRDRGDAPRSPHWRASPARRECVRAGPPARDIPRLPATSVRATPSGPSRSAPRSGCRTARPRSRPPWCRCSSAATARPPGRPRCCARRRSRRWRRRRRNRRRSAAPAGGRAGADPRWWESAGAAAPPVAAAGALASPAPSASLSAIARPPRPCPAPAYHPRARPAVANSAILPIEWHRWREWHRGTTENDLGFRAHRMLNPSPARMHPRSLGEHTGDRNAHLQTVPATGICSAPVRSEFSRSTAAGCAARSRSRFWSASRPSSRNAWAPRHGWATGSTWSAAPRPAR